MAGKKLVIHSFRPHEDLESDYWMIREWCDNNRSTFSSVINSFLPALNYALNNCVHENSETGERFVRADFGDVLLREIKNLSYG